VIRRGDTVLVEGEEKRIFAIEDPANPKRIKAVGIPAMSLQEDSAQISPD
jgi:4-hydroxybenzoyl-CoA thioesterase